MIFEQYVVPKASTKVVPIKKILKIGQIQLLLLYGYAGDICMTGEEVKL